MHDKQFLFLTLTSQYVDHLGVVIKYFIKYIKGQSVHVYSFSFLKGCDVILLSDVPRSEAALVSY